MYISDLRQKLRICANSRIGTLWVGYKDNMWQQYENKDALLLYDVLLHRNFCTRSLFF